MLDSVVTDVISQFTKRELINVAEEIGVKDPSSYQKVDMIKAMISLGNQLAHSEDTDTELSDEAMAFLVTAEVVDEDGNPLMEKESGSEEEEQLPEKLPGCWGYMDERAPECPLCKIKGLCKKRRLSRRPQCYGLLFDKHDPECQQCFEAPFCAMEIQNKEN